MECHLQRVRPCILHADAFEQQVVDQRIHTLRVTFRGFYALRCEFRMTVVGAVHHALFLHCAQEAADGVLFLAQAASQSGDGRVFVVVKTEKHSQAKNF